MYVYIALLKESTMHGNSPVNSRLQSSRFSLIFVSDPGDFTRPLLSEEVVFTPDNYETDLCVSVTIVDDSVYEEFEYFAVSLSTSDLCVEFKEELLPVGIADDDCEKCCVYTVIGTSTYTWGGA